MNGPQQTAVSRKELLEKTETKRISKETDIGGEELPGGNKFNHAWCSIDNLNRLLYEPPPKKKGIKYTPFRLPIPI